MTERKTGTRRGRWAMAAVVLFLAACGPGQTARTDPAAADSAMQTSFERYKEGQYEAAITAAKAALAANPNLAEAYNNIAVSYLGLRRFDEGIQAAREAIRLKPDFQLAKNNLAWIEREKVTAAAPRVPPTSAEILLTESLQRAQAGRFRECMDTATQSARLDPTSAAAFNNVGFCAGSLKLWDEAIKNTQEAIRLDPNLQLAKNNLAWMQQEKLKADAAKAR